MNNDVEYAALAIPRRTSVMRETVTSSLLYVHINVNLMLEVETR